MRAYKSPQQIAFEYGTLFGVCILIFQNLLSFLTEYHITSQLFVETFSMIISVAGSFFVGFFTTRKTMTIKDGFIAGVWSAIILIVVDTIAKILFALVMGRLFTQMMGMLASNDLLVYLGYIALLMSVTAVSIGTSGFFAIIGAWVSKRVFYPVSIKKSL